MNNLKETLNIMKKGYLKFGIRKAALSIAVVFSSIGLNAQTNVYDDIIATSPNHTSLKAALMQEGLDVALQDNMVTLTVFAPDNAAFDALAVELGTDINGLLALPNLSDILTYHVLGVSAQSSAINNGDVVTPLNAANTIKLTKTSGGDVYANQAMVNAADLMADNGYVHSINAVILPNETVVDVALDNGFSTLATAVITAELLPALTDPFASLTVFAPDNAAFDNLISALGTDVNGLLAMPELADILLYHVVSGTVMSTDLSNGAVPTLNGQSVNIDLSMGVMVNLSNVTLADVTADNGVVHVIDAVLLPSLAGIEETETMNLNVSPNPAIDELNISSSMKGDYEVINIYGATIGTGTTENGTLDISNLAKGNYFIRVTNSEGIFQAKFIKQ